jgi:hypothetical protein
VQARMISPNTSAITTTRPRRRKCGSYSSITHPSLVTPSAASMPARSQWTLTSQRRSPLRAIRSALCFRRGSFSISSTAIRKPNVTNQTHGSASGPSAPLPLPPLPGPAETPPWSFAHRLGQQLALEACRLRDSLGSPDCAALDYPVVGSLAMVGRQGSTSPYQSRWAVARHRARIPRHARVAWSDGPRTQPTPLPRPERRPQSPKTACLAPPAQPSPRRRASEGVMTFPPRYLTSAHRPGADAG